MKEVIYVLRPKEDTGNLVVLTHQNTNTTGWKAISDGISSQLLADSDKVVYLGKCEQDGDIFSVYFHGLILTCKGFLNSGMY